MKPGSPGTLFLLASCILTRCTARSNAIGGPLLVQPASRIDPSSSSIYLDSQHKHTSNTKISSRVTAKDLGKAGAWSAMPLLAASLSEIPALNRLFSRMLGRDVTAPHKIVKNIFARAAAALHMRPSATLSDDAGLPLATSILPRPSDNGPACKQARHRRLAGRVAFILLLVPFFGHVLSKGSRAPAARTPKVVVAIAKPEQASLPIQSASLPTTSHQTRDLQFGLGQMSSPGLNKQVEFYRMMTAEGPSRQVTAADGVADMENEMQLTADFYRISTEQAPVSPRHLASV